MAGVTLGFLRYVLGLDTIEFRKGMTQAERDLVVMQKKFAKVGDQMVGMGKSLSVGLTLPLAGFAAKGIKEAQETAEAMAQVNAALASMGPVAGRSAKQLSSMADSLEANSLFEADQILQKVTANLLTFGNISGQAFDRAQQAAVNLATRLGTDLQSATILVGKALNDPIKGMAALGRTGIQFTAQQKQVIKSMVEGGNAAGAQALILKELERQFGGAAEAAQNADPWNKLTDAWNRAAESIGTALLPLIPPLTDAIVSVADAFASLSPETQKWVLILGGVAAALGPVLIGVGSLIKLLAMSKTLVLFASGLTGIGAAGTTAATGATAAGIAVRALLGPIGLAITAATALYLAWKNWDKIGPIVSNMVSAVGRNLAKLAAPFAWVTKQAKLVGDAFFKLYDRVVGNSYVPDMVEGIAAEMAKLDAVLVQPVTKATTKAAEAFRELQTQTQGLLNRLFPEAAALNTFKAEMDLLDQAMKRNILTTDQYTAALQRLQTEGLTDVPIGVADQGSLVPENEQVFDEIGKVADRLPEVVDKTKEWQEIVGRVGEDLARMGGDILSGLIDKSLTLKDAWRGLLSYAIQFLTSQDGAKFLSGLFGGARAHGGPVDMGKTYLVGEKGPELFSPSRSGRIIPNNQLSGAMIGRGGWYGDMHIHTNDADSFRRNQRQISRDANRRLAVA